VFSTLYHGRIKLIYGQNLAFSDIMGSWRCFLHYIMAEVKLNRKFLLPIKTIRYDWCLNKTCFCNLQMLWNVRASGKKRATARVLRSGIYTSLVIWLSIIKSSWNPVITSEQVEDQVKEMNENNLAMEEMPAYYDIWNWQPDRFSEVTISFQKKKLNLIVNFCYP
jgi:hypothetical protein